MAKVTIQRLPPPPPPPPSPKIVTLELSWDEFCLILKTVGDTNSSLLTKGYNSLSVEVAQNNMSLYQTLYNAYKGELK